MAIFLISDHRRPYSKVNNIRLVPPDHPTISRGLSECLHSFFPSRTKNLVAMNWMYIRGNVLVLGRFCFASWSYFTVNSTSTTHLQSVLSHTLSLQRQQSNFDNSSEEKEKDKQHHALAYSSSFRAERGDDFRFAE